MVNLRRDGGIALLIGILTIIFLTQGIFGIPPITEWEIWQQDETSQIEPQIELSMEPEFINEGQYDEIAIQINFPDVEKKNITFLSLTKDNIIIDRIDKNEQIKVASSIRWSDSYNDRYVLYYRADFYSGKVLKASGKLGGCNNCFMGEDFPYRFTYTLQYKIGDGPTKTITIEKTIPII